MFILYSFPSINIADLCARFWEELLIVLHSPDPDSPVYNLIFKLMTATLPHLMFPEVCSLLFIECRMLIV